MACEAEEPNKNTDLALRSSRKVLCVVSNWASLNVPPSVLLSNPQGAGVAH